MSGHWQVVDEGSNSSVTVVSFGGIAGGMNMPPFEFFRLLSAVNARKIFVRDVSRGYYLCGLGSATMAETASCIEELAGGRRVVAIGTSAGGFGALLYGAMLGAARVLAFSPVTSLARGARIWRLDRRNVIRKELALWRSRAQADRIVDVRDILRRSPVPASIHYDMEDKIDRRHAQVLASIPGVELVPHVGGGHLLVRSLKEQGVLQDLIREAVASVE